jgi:hypothetical protein
MELKFSKKTYFKRGVALVNQIQVTPIADKKTFETVEILEVTVQSANWMIKHCKNKRLIIYNCQVIEASEDLLHQIKNDKFH